MRESEKLIRDLAASEDVVEGCILWNYTKDNNGYGKIRLNGSIHYAHRLVMELKYGPSNLHVLHSPVICRNPSCINPAHMRYGTHQENMRDRGLDGVSYKGEDNPNSKLTIEQVREIRSSPLNTVQLGKIYGVGKSQISKIKRNEMWKDIK